MAITGLKTVAFHTYSMRDASSPPGCAATSGSAPDQRALYQRTVPSLDPKGLRDSLATVPEPLKAKIDKAKEYNPDIDEEYVAAMTVSASVRKPTFLQRERWKAVQEAKRRGLSIGGMARELGIRRETVRRYIDAESPPTRRTPATPPAPTSDTITD